eukprot:TRINITY_DN30830_c0_g1_i1.p1 TRINITY_DN30830_c0_g1~~TRINITY_DN30830_c0_g1_i1.p1  ORF type:complete len:457 (+),score=100.01 TRINITY_DN30830_c0_g1_i1:57-1373(+)
MSSGSPATFGSPFGLQTVPSSDTDLSTMTVEEESIWSHVPQAPPDAVFGIVAEYKRDPCNDKVDLVVGAYRDEDGRPYLLESVSAAEIRIANTKLDKEYLPIDGLKEFRDAAVALALGEDSLAAKEKRVMSIQTLSGTGALQIAAALSHKFSPDSTVYVSNPTWANHRGIFEAAGCKVATYRYWCGESKSLDFDGMVTDLKTASHGSVVVLHLCAHNPTGVDPTRDQWKRIAEVCREKRHRVVFDSAYQGYCSGDLDNDAWAARYFESEGLEFSITQSFSKNMGLYGERVGCFMQVTNTPQVAEALASQAKAIARVTYSNPPKHGARIAAMILTDPSLRAQWVEELKGMSVRIIRMRELLFHEMQEQGTPGDWGHIISQKGMFSFTGVSPKQVKHIVSKHNVYMLGSGRISVAGVTEGNVKKIARAFHDAVVSSTLET